MKTVNLNQKQGNSEMRLQTNELINNYEKSIMLMVLSCVKDLEIKVGKTKLVSILQGSESNYIFSDWIIDGVNISNVRSNTNFSGSFIIQKPISDKRIHLQNLSLTFNRQNTKDSPDSSMGYFLGNENWEQAGSILNLTFNSNFFLNNHTKKYKRGVSKIATITLNKNPEITRTKNLSLGIISAIINKETIVNVSIN